VGVADDELFAHFIAHIVEAERRSLFFYTAMENDLEQYISELFAKKLGILEVDSLDDFAGLLKKVVSDRGVSLFSVPRTAALAAKKSDDVDKIADRVMIFLLIFDHKKNSLNDGLNNIIPYFSGNCNPYLNFLSIWQNIFLKHAAVCIIILK
jgi:hypothetical protein